MAIVLVYNGLVRYGLYSEELPSLGTRLVFVYVCNVQGERSSQTVGRRDEC